MSGLRLCITDLRTFSPTQETSFKDQVYKMFDTLNNDVLAPTMGKLFDDLITPSITRITDRLAERLARKFLLPRTTRHIADLINVVQPMNLWQHPDAPIFSWAARDLAGLDLQPVVEAILNTYLPALQLKAKELMADKISGIFQQNSIINFKGRGEGKLNDSYSPKRTTALVIPR